MTRAQQIQEEILDTIKEEMPMGSGMVVMAEHTRLSFLKLFERLDEIEEKLKT